MKIHQVGSLETLTKQARGLQLISAAFPNDRCVRETVEVSTAADKSWNREHGPTLERLWIFVSNFCLGRQLWDRGIHSHESTGFLWVVNSCRNSRCFFFYLPVKAQNILICLNHRRDRDLDRADRLLKLWDFSSVARKFMIFHQICIGCNSSTRTIRLIHRFYLQCLLCEWRNSDPMLLIFARPGD